MSMQTATPSQIKRPPVWRDVRDAVQTGSKIIALEGGSRSSKTWSILLHLILDRAGEGLTITAVRERLSWMKNTVIDDLEEIIDKYNIPIRPQINANRQHQEYHILGNKFRFMGMDDAQKVHGQKQDIFWINEAVEVKKADFDQLEMRTNEYGILDYNPAMSDGHWIVKNVLSRPDTVKLHSTMLDNPFLPESIRQKILSYKPTPENIAAGTADETNWKIYGLGERALQKGLVYDNWQIVPEMPNTGQWHVHGMDFGFTNDPSTLIELRLFDGKLWVDEKLYKTGLTNVSDNEDRQPSIDGELNAMGFSKQELIVGDSAEPKSIQELRNKGWSIKGAEKGPDSIRQGIQLVKRYKLMVTERSTNIIQELRNYKWKEDAEGEKDNKPVDAFNHALDPIRYAAEEKMNKQEPWVMWG